MQRKLETLADANPARSIPLPVTVFRRPPAIAVSPRRCAAEGAVQAESDTTGIWVLIADVVARSDATEATHLPSPVQRHELLRFALRKRFAFIAGNDEEERNAFRRRPEDSRRPGAKIGARGQSSRPPGSP